MSDLKIASDSGTGEDKRKTLLSNEQLSSVRSARYSHWESIATAMVVCGVTALALAWILSSAAGFAMPLAIGAIAISAGAGFGLWLGLIMSPDGTAARLLSAVWRSFNRGGEFRQTRLEHLKNVRPATVSDSQRQAAGAIAGGITALALVAILAGLTGLTLPFLVAAMAMTIGAVLGLLVGGKAASDGLVVFVLGAVWVGTALLAGAVMVFIEIIGVALAALFAGFG